MNLLELEVSGDPWASAEAVQDCVTRALAAPLAPHIKILFSQRGLQFAEDYSNSIQRLEFNRSLLILLNILNPICHVTICLLTFLSCIVFWLCPLQCAFCVWRPPETIEGAGWNEERSREWVRGVGTTHWKIKWSSSKETFTINKHMVRMS